jgi:hypothetical protein
VDANSANLIIINSTKSNPKVIRAIENNNVYVFPLSWLLTNKLHEARLIDRTLTLSRIINVHTIGVAGPGRLGTPIFSYFLLMLFGLLTMQFPLLVKFDLEVMEKKDLNEIKIYLCSIINKYPENYSKSTSNALLKRVETADTFDKIVTSIGRD